MSGELDHLPSPTAPDAPRPTHPGETRSGLNRITVRTVQFGLQPMFLEKDLALQVRDGHTLYANVFRPVKEGKHPVLIAADIYGKDSIHLEYAKHIGYTLGGYDASQFTPWEAPDPGFWVPNGYVLVKAALRGTAGSKGNIEPLSWQEAEDFHDFVEWAGVQPWSNGNVGSCGVSYLAMCQWRMAQLNPPHLKAMIPWEGISDMYREWSFHGGIPETAFSRGWIKGVLRRATPGSTVEELEKNEAAHPLWDAYWEGKHGNLADIRVPMYVGASWSTQGLHNRGTIEGFRQASSKHKWIEIHGRKEWETYYGREAHERQKAFLDHFLKGVENDWMDTPRVRIEVRERFYQGLPRYESEWPIARTQYKPLYLDARNGSLSHGPQAQESSASYDSTAKLSAESREGRALFTHRFDADTELTGYMKLKLWVSADASDDLDLFIGIHKLDRRGKEIHFGDFNHIENGRVASGWLRVSHRELDPKRSTPYQPWHRHTREQKIRPGEVVPVEIEIWPSSTLFRAGESVQVSVQGGDVPRPALDALPALHSANRYQHEELVNRGRHTIHSGAKYDSHLLVPIVPPK
jgi:predicted acyl esterase